VELPILIQQDRPYANHRLPSDSVSLPVLVPEVDALAGEAELAGDLGLGDAGGEQLGGAQPPGLKPFTCSLCRRTDGTVGIPGSCIADVARSNSTTDAVRPPPKTFRRR
jgi:hypothetical protein